MVPIALDTNAPPPPSPLSRSSAPSLSAPPLPRSRVFVVGLGMVGLAFIEKLLQSDEEGRRYSVVTCGEEPFVAYNRVGLTEYFQHRNIEELYLNDLSWYAEQEPERFQFHIGEAVSRRVRRSGDARSSNWLPR
jgi:nitrite reductase (NAD(P)H)